MRTDAELDQRHAEIVARFPDGITPPQYRQVTLESADEDGKIYPHSVASHLTQFSLLMGMWLDGLIENRGGGHHKPFRWYITDKGRASLSASTSPSSQTTGAE